MPLWLIIGIGSFIGGILRYWISGWVQSGVLVFPLGTLSVNFIGSLILSLIVNLSEQVGFFSQEAKVFWTIGLLGSFTTMSAFSYESFRLLEQNENILFGLNVISTIVLTLVTVYFGKLIVINYLIDVK